MKIIEKIYKLTCEAIEKYNLYPYPNTVVLDVKTCDELLCELCKENLIPAYSNIPRIFGMKIEIKKDCNERYFEVYYDPFDY